MINLLIDLDVVTVGLWDSGKSGELARDFMSRVAKKEFVVVTPFLLLERISKWENIALTERMKEFYVKNSDILLTDEDIRQRIREVGSRSGGFNEASMLKELRGKGIGSQDAFLVLIASIFELALVTFNRKTLRSKEEKIREVTDRYGIKAVRIVGPERL